MSIASFRHARRYLVVSILLLLVPVYIIIGHVHIIPDAYITFRVVDNAVHGYGLRWNVAERVQAYTAPLWMLLHIPFYALWNKMEYIDAGLSIMCTFLALGISIYTLRKPWKQTAIFFIIPLSVSTCFLEYSVAGMENPLGHCLFAFFGWALLRGGRPRFWFWISFFFALSLFNRLDTVLLYLPVLSHLIATRWRTVRVRQCALGLLPIIGWEIFSLFYYGFLFPNTKYAKMNTGIPGSVYARQGIHYLLNLIATDFSSACFLLFAAVIYPVAMFLRKPKIAARAELPYMALGILCYLLYIISIGGTYMSGRLWSLPVFASIWLIYAISDDYAHRLACDWLAAGMIVLKLFYPSFDDLQSRCSACYKGGIYAMGPRYLWLHSADAPARPRAPTAGSTAPNEFAQDDPGDKGLVRQKVKINPDAAYAYVDGPDVYLLSPLAISDPLLARLPIAHADAIKNMARISFREIPQGYIHALKTGDTSQMSPSLAPYYTKLHFIISGDLWSMNRIIETIKFNLGDYDYLRDAYLAEQRPLS